MKRWLIACSIVLAGAGLLFAAQVNGYFDFFQIATPSNPASGSSRVYIDSTAHQLKCLNSDGSSCAPSGGGGATVGGLYVTSGTNWGPVFPGLVIPPVASSWTAVGLSAVSLSDISGGGLSFETSINNWSGYTEAIPGAMWTLTALLTGSVEGGASNGHGQGFFGIFCRDSATGNAALFHYQIRENLSVSTWSNAGLAPTTPSFVSGLVGSYNPMPFSGWLRIQVDSTNRTYSYSNDGQSWYQYYQEAKTAFVTCNEIGFEGAQNGSGSTPGLVTVVSFNATTP